MPNVSTERLLELELRSRLAPLAAHRRMYVAAVGDLVNRAVASGRFLIGPDDEFVEREPLASWLDELSNRSDAEYLFACDPALDSQRAPEQGQPYGGLTKAEFDRLPARKKLEIANAQAARKAS